MLETWAADGTPMQRIGDRVFKTFGVASVGWSHTGSTQSGNIVDSRFEDHPGCIPIVFVVDGKIDSTNGGVSFAFAGDTLTWSYANPTGNSLTRPNATFLYGIL